MHSSFTRLLLGVGTALALGVSTSPVLVGCGASPAVADATLGPASIEDGGTQLLDGSSPAPASDGDPSADTDGGASDGASASTWAIPSGPPDCDPTKPFGKAAPVVGIPRASFNVSLAPDERVMFLGMRDPSTGTLRIAQAVRADRSLPFGAPTFVPSLTGAAADQPVFGPAITADGLTIFYHYGQGLMRATRASVADPFGVRTIVRDGTEDVDTQSLAAVSPDGSAIYMSRYASGSLYRFPTNALSGQGVAETALNAPLAGSTYVGGIFMAAVSHDGKRIIYGKTLDNSAAGAIVTATRTSTTAPFGDVTVMSEFPAKKLQAYPTWLSPDGCRLYMLEGSGIELPVVMATRPH